jgi:nicotinamide-nucleotide amidase
MVEAFTRALERSDAVLVTGGLGPTPDDITREAVAAVAGRRLVRRSDLATKIEQVFERLGREMPEDNLRQADLPEGAVAIEAEGTAPGFQLDMDGKVIFALPGVPWEMRAMLDKDVLPELRSRAGEAVIVSREILIVGMGESQVHAKIADIVDDQSNPTIAYLAGGGRVKVRVTAKSGTDADARGLIAPVEVAIRDRLGIAVVEGGEAGLAAAFGAHLTSRGATVAVAESLTGGRVGAELTSVPGASDFFLGSLVVYATEAKRDLCGVPEDILERHGAVSKETAAALAEAAASRFGATLGLSTTGVAGPDEQEGKPPGTVFVGAHLAGKTEVRQVKGYGDRENIVALSVSACLDLGRRLLLEA